MQMSASDQLAWDLMAAGRLAANPTTGEVFYIKRSVKSGLPLIRKYRPFSYSNGYKGITAKDESGNRHSILVHHIVWMAQHGQIPDHLEIDHKDYNPANNRALNLRLVSHGANVVRSRQCKLNFDKAAEIRKLAADGVMKKDIATRFGVTAATISRVCLNKGWHKPELLDELRN